jgi:8-oxo-dGTP diphosphatase
VILPPEAPEHAASKDVTKREVASPPVSRQPERTVMHRFVNDFSDDHGTSAPVTYEALPGVPRIPASAGALIFDEHGGLLILKPSYKKGWTIPGGQIEADGESPWAACQRETREECGLEVSRGRLVCVDYLWPKPTRPGGARFLFHCGTFSDRQLKAISLQAEEIVDCRLVSLAEALKLLSGPLRRRVSASAGTDRCLYLENGRQVAGVSV